MGGASPYRARFIALPPQNGGNEGGSCDDSEKYFGFVNVANTCYVNSVLQALYFCKPFRRSIIRHLAEEREDDSTSESLLSTLAELFSQIESQKKTVGCLTPRRFLAKLRKANDLFCTSEHQDAHEFMQFLLNDIGEHVTKRLVRQQEREKERHRQKSPDGQSGQLLSAEQEEPEEEPRTWLHDIFQGYLVNQMKCLCCENVTVRRETFLDLSVDIEQHTSVAACLRAFESTELLRAGNKFFCDTCGCLQEAEKRLRVYQLPNVLTLHLKRFKYVERLGRCCRLPYRVVFPLQLRVVEHRPQNRHASAGLGSSGRGDKVELGSATDGSATVDGDESSTPSRLYELRSVVIHIGRDSSRGHYVTIVRNGDRCVLLDDDIVRVVEPEVLRSFYGTAGGSASQYGQGGGGAHERQSPHGNSGGWSADDSNDRPSGGDRFPTVSPNVPLYERSPEGVCCGYLLFYEAVDGMPESDASSVVDVGAAADWISEDQNFDQSDSGESGEERQGNGHAQDFPNICDDSELTQAFEQRCIPRSTASRQKYAVGFAASAPANAAGAGNTGDLWNRVGAAQGPTVGNGLSSGAAGHGGAFAWAATDGEGGRAPQAVGNHSGHGVRALGSVVPAAGTADTVSPSRVNVVTVPSPTGSLEGAGGAETERG